MNDLPIPYSDYLYLEPVQDTGVLSNTLNSYAKVLAIGQDVKHTKVGDYVAYEKWDKPEFLDKNNQSHHFIREREAICILPPSWI